MVIMMTMMMTVATAILGDPDGADFVAVGCEGSELYPACQESQLGGLGVAQPQAATIAMVATTILLAQ